MKTTIQKFSVDKNGNKVKALGTCNHIRSESFYSNGELTVEVDGNSNGRNYMTTMTLKSSDTETVQNSKFNSMPGWGKSQLAGFGLGFLMNQPAKKRKYGIEIDGKYFFVIQTDADLQNLGTFINI